MESVNNDINANLEKFKNKLLNTGNSISQLGGKGTVRRKKKNTNFKLSKKKIKTQSEMNLENIIKRINTYFNEILFEEFEMFDVWFQDHILFYFDNLNKYEVKSKTLLSIIKEEPVEFFFSNFTHNNSENVYKLINDIDILSKFFNQDGIEFLINFYQETENILINKKYVEEKKESDTNIFTTKECYNILGFEMSDDITINDLKQKYRKLAIQMHPDKHPNEQEIYHEKFQNLSKAYKQLLQNFNEK